MLEKLKGTFDKGLAAVSVKSESIVETSRTRSARAGLQRQREEAVTALGEQTYAAWKAGALEPQALEEACAAISALEDEIAKLDERLEQIKREEEQLLGKSVATGGAKFCASCGAAISGGAKFCASCGKPVE